ncbi:MAG TPA: hypothetical protein VFK09_03930 [Gemmatimonadales bacterium]|nr:hypothetical protein [Gemmatimonadales bacterium]
MSGPVGAIVIAGLAVSALVVWLLRDRRYPGPRLVDAEPLIDHEELERAEREIREFDPPPDHEMLREEWRPGRPRPPERL